ncbi:MAG: SCO family protein [Marmoricola sp.]
MRARVATLAALALLVAAALAGCGAATPAAAPTISGGAELGAHLPASVLHLPLTDARGRTVHLADFAGKTIVLQDMLTLCQEHCPIDTAAFVGAARAWAGTAHASDVVFLSITVDPRRDTPAQLAAYRRLYARSRADLPRWRLLTGSPHDIATLWKALHVYVHRVPQDGVVRNWRTGARLTYDVDHGDDVYFIGPKERERYLIDGQPALGGEPMPPAMQRFMSREGRANEKAAGWTAADALKVLDWLAA